MPAYRNVRLCGKDCMCLYVCPTGATDTENSIVDVSKCTGCMACVYSCPSGAISMVPGNTIAYTAAKNNTERSSLRRGCHVW